MRLAFATSTAFGQLAWPTANPSQQAASTSTSTAGRAARQAMEAICDGPKIPASAQAWMLRLWQEAGPLVCAAALGDASLAVAVHVGLLPLLGTEACLL